MRSSASFLCALGALFLSLAAFASAAQPEPSSSADPLAHLRPGHPRLLLTDAELTAAIAAAKTDPLRAQLHAHIIEVARNQLTEPTIEHRLIGPRMLDQSRKAIAHILTAAMAFRLTGEARYADFAKRDLLTAAGFADWNPSHFLDVAELSCALAIGYDWLYAQLSPAERTTIKTAMIEKGLSFAASAYKTGGSPDKRLWFPGAHHNWNQVCNGGLLASALALADEEPDLARTVIAGVRESLPRAMEAYQPDGAFPEGPAYWDYGTNYNVLVLALLEGSLGTDFGLGAAPGFDRTALYRLYVQSPTGLAFNYADGGTSLGPTAEYSWLAQRYHQPAALVHSRELLAAAMAKNPRKSSDRFLALNAVWFPVAPENSGAAIAATPLDVRFRGPAQLVMLRSAWNDPKAVWVGLKGGSNTVNHAHLDLGSFVLDALGVRWAVDLGPDDYNLPDYFGKKRWTYFRLNNQSHNTISPANMLQDSKADAPIVAFHSGEHESSAIVDLTNVYPGAAKKLRRGIALLDRSRVLVQDEASGLKPGTALSWRMLTEAKVAAAGGTHLRLTQRGQTLDVDLLEPKRAEFSVRPATPPTPAEKPNTGVSLISIEISGDTDARLVVLLSPVVGASPPARDNPNVRPLAEWPTSEAGH